MGYVQSWVENTRLDQNSIVQNQVEKEWKKR